MNPFHQVVCCGVVNDRNEFMSLAVAIECVEHVHAHDLVEVQQAWKNGGPRTCGPPGTLTNLASEGLCGLENLLVCTGQTKMTSEISH